MLLITVVDFLFYQNMSCLLFYNICTVPSIDDERGMSEQLALNKYRMLLSDGGRQEPGRYVKI